jgi:5,5'-dehydrodivanillate O-demethylase
VTPIRLLGENLTLYRSEAGVAHAVAERCAHRGVRLSLGMVQGEDIKCSYHGWKFNSAGACVDQPAELRPFYDGVKIRAYPTTEYLGLVFIFLGDGSPPELPRLQDYEDSEFLELEVFEDTWPCSFFDLLENATDMAHTDHLHWHFGTRTSGKFEWRETEWGMMGQFSRTQTEGAPRQVDSIYDNAYFNMPTAAEFAIVGRVGFSGYYSVAWRIPRDDNSAIRFNVIAKPRFEVEALKAQSTDGKAGSRAVSDEVRSKHPVVEVAAGMLAGREDMLDLKERSASMNFFYLTNIQDCAVLASLGPPPDRTFRERLGSSDVSVMLMRRLWLRELTAFAEGRAQKQWRRPPLLWGEVTSEQRKSAAEFKAKVGGNP